MKKALALALAISTFAAFEVPAHAGLIADFCSRLINGPVSATRTALEQKDDAIWTRITPDLKTELETFSKLDSKQREQYLKKVSDEFSARHSDKAIGAHYNLHGGIRADYLDRNGISFSIGDSGLEHGFSRDARQKVYFFNLKHVSLYEVLNTKNPSHVYTRSRMGNVLTLFDVTATAHFLNQTYPGAIEENEISFSLESGRNVTTRGVPSRFYLTVPMEVFSNYKKRLARSLSWDDETLVTMRLIEAHLIAGPQLTQP